MRLWQRVRGWFVREDEPGLDREEAPDVSSVQYPRPGELDEGDGGESADAQREGDGFR